MKMKKSIVVSTIIHKTKHYVSNAPMRCDGGKKWAVLHTTVPEEAKEFKSTDLAIQFTNEIKNPFDRVYKWDTVEVNIDLQRKLLQKQSAEEALT